MEGPASISFSDNTSDTACDKSTSSASDLDNNKLEGEELKAYIKTLRKREHLIKISKKTYGINVIHNQERTKIFARVICHSNS